MHDLIVIGAGPGGYEAAAHAGQLGKKVLLVEAGSLGGACLNVGCIPAKVFLRSSRLYRECNEAGPFGVRVEGVSFDAPVVVERKNRIVAALGRGVAAKLKGAGVEVVTGRARLQGRHRVQVGDEQLEAENVLVATGSRPAVPPIPGIGAEHVLNSDRVFDLAEVPQSIAIIGGGYIGLELATYFREVGAEVAIFEMLPQIAANCDSDVSVRLLQALKRGGIDFHLACRVLAVEEGALRYDDGSGTPKTHAADRILNATGRAPVVAGLGLEEVGVDLAANARFLGYMHQFQARRGNIWVVPSVFLLTGAVSIRANSEVSSHLWVPLVELLGRESRATFTLVRGEERMTFPSFNLRGYVVWGLTERILSSLAGSIGDEPS